MSGGGTSADQGTRFSHKQAKLPDRNKFPPVDFTKVRMPVLRPWISQQISKICETDDEITKRITNYLCVELEEGHDGNKIQEHLTKFMGESTVEFMKDLWSRLLSAQTHEFGVPRQLLDEWKAKRKQAKGKQEKEGRVSEMEKDKITDADAGNSRSFGDTDSSALNSTNFIAKRENENDYKHRLKNRSRSISLSPRGRQRSISPRNNSRSPPGGSVSPRRHPQRSTLSISRRRSPYPRRGSPPLSRFSPGRHPSPSPARRRPRSPYPRRRTPSPGRRTPSPVRRRHKPPSQSGRCRLPSQSPGRRRPLSRSAKRPRRSPSLPKFRSANQCASSQERRSTSPNTCRSPYRSSDIEKETNGNPSIKDRDVHQRGQEQSSHDHRDGATIAGLHDSDLPPPQTAVLSLVPQLLTPQKRSLEELEEVQHVMPCKKRRTVTLSFSYIPLLVFLDENVPVVPYAFVIGSKVGKIPVDGHLKTTRNGAIVIDGYVDQFFKANDQGKSYGGCYDPSDMLVSDEDPLHVLINKIPTYEASRYNLWKDLQCLVDNVIKRRYIHPSPPEKKDGAELKPAYLEDFVTRVQDLLKPKDRCTQISEKEWEVRKRVIRHHPFLVEASKRRLLLEDYYKFYKSIPKPVAATLIGNTATTYFQRWHVLIASKDRILGTAYWKRVPQKRPPDFYTRNYHIHHDENEENYNHFPYTSEEGFLAVFLRNFLVHGLEEPMTKGVTLEELEMVISY